MPRTCLRILLASVMLVLSASTYASTFTCSSGDVACLIAAINTANTNGEPENTIRLSPGTYTLTAVDNDTQGPNGLPSVTSTLTIRADVDGSEVMVVRAATAPGFRFLHAGSGAVLTVHGITLSGGDLTAVSLPAGSRDGAGIYMAGAQVALTHAVLIGNRGGTAGAIYSDGGTLTVTDTRIDDNRGTGSPGGSAVRTLGGTVSFVRSEIARSFGNGSGALHATNPELLWMEDTRFLENNMFFGAGALHLEGGAAVLVRMTFERNRAQDEGALLVRNATLVVRDSAFVANLFGAGSGVLMASGSTVDIFNTTFVRNTGSLPTASVMTTGGSQVTVVNSTITGNTGPARVFSGPVTLMNTIVQHADPSLTPCIPAVTSLGGHNIFDGAAASCAVALHPSDVIVNPGLGTFVDTDVPGGGHVPLLEGSPAIDAADTSGCPVLDQLGRSRVGPCDIGAVEYLGSVGGSNPSPSGTRLPPAPAIIDSDLASWTIGPNLETLRNGVHAGGGYGSTYLWYEGVLYVLGTDFNWWRWTGSNWIVVGPNDPAGGPSASPSGARLPPAPAITDNDLASWTIGPNLETLRNGVHAGGGYGSSYLWYQNVLYVVGTDANWWRWTGSSWIVVGPNDPAGGPSPSPSGTRLPPATAIVDNDLASWTIGPNLETLRNGVHAGGGYGSTYLWYGGVLYVVGTDDNWWRWTGSGWVLVGPLDPSS